MAIYGEKNVAITGIGLSAVSRRASKSALALTIDACMEAIEDAGLTRADIDGVSSYAGSDNNTSGYSPVGVPNVLDALRLNVDWYSGAMEVPGQLGAVFNAIGAICAGLSKNVLIFRTMYEATARRNAPFANALARPGQRIRDPWIWFSPYFTLSAATQQALYFQRYVFESGIKPEQTAQIAINGRRNASLNPAAVYRTPITLDDYMNSPIISTPLRLYDCDVPIDGSVALVLSRKDIAKDLRNPPIRVEAVGSALHYRHSWDQLESPATQITPSPARHMWSRTDLKPSDVDVAQLYDGFTFHTLMWLESFGFCEKYGAGAFVEGGSRIALEGELPINTGGGQLSAGRLHAYGQVHEACTQLWQRGGDRQVGNDPKVAATSTAGGPLGGCLLLVRE